MRKYKATADEIKEAAVKHLFSQDMQSFVRHVIVDESGIHKEEVVDASSLFGLWYFGMFDQNDELFVKTQQQVVRRLKNPTPVGGYFRYERDNYFKSKDISNPWFITTLWEAERLLHKKEVTPHDLEFVEQTLNWVLEYVYPSGVLAEQLDPYTHKSLSATPLVWSHAVYVETVLLFLEKKVALDPGAKPQAPVHEL